MIVWWGQHSTALESEEITDVVVERIDGGYEVRRNEVVIAHLSVNEHTAHLWDADDENIIDTRERENWRDMVAEYVEGQ